MAGGLMILRHRRGRGHGRTGGGKMVAGRVGSGLYTRMKVTQIGLWPGHLAWNGGAQSLSRLRWLQLSLLLHLQARAGHSPGAGG